MRRFLFTTLLFPLVSHATFLFPDRCDPQRPAQRCLVGDIAPSQAVLLLAPDGQSTCGAATTGTVKLLDTYDEPYVATTLDTTGCPRADYDLAVVGTKSIVYKPHALLATQDLDAVHRIHELASQNDLYMGAKRHLQERLPNRPNLYSIGSPQDSAYLAHYPIVDFAARSGPLFFVTNKVVMEVDPEASIVRTMEIDGQMYVLIEHTCWDGCGNAYRKLLQINSEQFHEVTSHGRGT